MVEPTPEQMEDLLDAWYINISVRSNGVVIVKNGQTLAVGTGEQDRVGAVEQAIEKFSQKYKGPNTLEGVRVQMRARSVQRSRESRWGLSGSLL